GLLTMDALLLPHEKTLDSRLEAICQTYRHLLLQTTPIHVLASAAWEAIFPLLQNYLSCPRFSVGGVDGVMHRWTPIHHLKHQEFICEKIGRGPFFIADGHHRWKAALDVGAIHLLVYVTPLQDGSLHIVPTHRLVEGKVPFLEALQKYFEFRSSTARVPLWREIQGLRYAIGIVEPGGKAWTARLRPSYWSYLQERPMISWLHEWVFDSAEKVEFSRDPIRMIEAATRGEGWAFLLPPLRIEEVHQAALQGQKLPPKSTYFFPKVLSGMCFYYEGDTRIGFAAP
ncbi:MAG: DUF1015 domain-containing protein, partial [Bacteroidia bacterium]|nr:DUF1015 domain-containing protein [Bacteroidia bacterium]